MNLNARIGFMVLLNGNAGTRLHCSMWESLLYFLYLPFNIYFSTVCSWGWGVICGVGLCGSRYV